MAVSFARAVRTVAGLTMVEGEVVEDARPEVLEDEPAGAGMEPSEPLSEAPSKAPRARNPLVIALMAASAGNSPFEQQVSGPIVQEGLSRSFCSEASRFDSHFIRKHRHARNARRIHPKIGFHPLLGNRSRLEENHERAHLVLKSSHQHRQFTDACPRARTLRMR